MVVVKSVRGLILWCYIWREPRANNVPAAAVIRWRGSVTGHY